MLRDLHLDPFLCNPSELAQMAAEDLMHYLETQNDFVHNFGFEPKSIGPVIGKMFGVLVVKGLNNEIGYLASFSGKLGNSNDHAYFVPPVYDMLAKGEFISEGMKNLQVLSATIETERNSNNTKSINNLLQKRAQLSKRLQQQLFEQYNFLNSKKEHKNVIEIFRDKGYKNPPSASGECAAPKLLQYAFKNKLEPLSLAEFWWGQSPKSNHWVHRRYYPACEEKCRPILEYMLG